MSSLSPELHSEFTIRVALMVRFAVLRAFHRTKPRTQDWDSFDWRLVDGLRAEIALLRRAEVLQKPHKGR